MRREPKGLQALLDRTGTTADTFPMALAVPTKLGDVVMFSHDTFHASFNGGEKRRAYHPIFSFQSSSILFEFECGCVSRRNVHTREMSVIAFNFGRACRLANLTSFNIGRTVRGERRQRRKSHRAQVQDVSDLICCCSCRDELQFAKYISIHSPGPSNKITGRGMFYPAIFDSARGTERWTRERFSLSSRTVSAHSAASV